MGDEDEQVQGYMSLSGDFGDEVPADIVLWNETGSEILFRLAMEMVPENRYQLLVRYAGEKENNQYGNRED